LKTLRPSSQRKNYLYAQKGGGEKKKVNQKKRRGASSQRPTGKKERKREGRERALRLVLKPGKHKGKSHRHPAEIWGKKKKNK